MRHDERGPGVRAGAEHSPFLPSRYRLSVARPGEIATIADDEGTVLLTYRACGTATRVIGGYVSAAILLAGAAATLLLLNEGLYPRAVVVIALTIGFIGLIQLLVPRLVVRLHHQEEPALVLSERRGFFSSAVAIVTSDQVSLGEIRRSPLSLLGRDRWRIRRSGIPLAVALEDGFGRALLRKLLGRFSRRFQSDFVLLTGGLRAGSITRKAEAGGEPYLLELSGDLLDRRLAIALAALIVVRDA